MQTWLLQYSDMLKQLKGKFSLRSGNLLGFEAVQTCALNFVSLAHTFVHVHTSSFKVS